MSIIEDVKEYNRTGVNPNTKKYKADQYGLDEDKIIHEDNSLLSLMIDLDSYTANLDAFVGNLNNWLNNCSKSDWTLRITQLLALQEIYPVREKISEILNNEPADKSSDRSQHSNKSNEKEDTNLIKIRDRSRVMVAKDSTYAKNPETIELFMTVHYSEKSSLDTEVTKALKRINDLDLPTSKKESIKEELMNASQSTLYTWRKWVDDQLLKKFLS